MTSLVARTQRIAATARAAQPTREANAKRYPEFAAWVAEYRAVFGAKLVRVQYHDTGKEWP